jgi:16S rRNA A1518/A1519 N6-dimethyltransferase RsmA/KsgA/DIM1 with predicted DNA glycosylase/AP lyase activity
MAAAPGSKTYWTTLRVMIQYRFRWQKLFDVPPARSGLHPSGSAFVRLLPRAALPLTAAEEQVLAEWLRKLSHTAQDPAQRPGRVS